MPRAHRGVADFKAVYDFIGFISVFNFIVEFFEVSAVPLFGFVEFLDDGLADGLAAHVHGDEARGEKGTVFVAVYFFKNQAEHRSVDQRFVVFLDFFPAFCPEIVGVQERKQVLERAQVAGLFFALLVFQHGLRKNRDGFAVFQVADKQGDLFQVGRLEERRVEVGDFLKHLLHVFVPFLVFAGQHLKKQAVQVVVVLDFVGVEKRVRWVAFVVGDELGFQ